MLKKKHPSKNNAFLETVIWKEDRNWGVDSLNKSYIDVLQRYFCNILSKYTSRHLKRPSGAQRSNLLDN